MAISKQVIEEIKEYCKIEDDRDAESFALAAVQKLEVETGKIFDEAQPLYMLAVKMLVEDWFDHRGNITTENIRELPLAIGVQAIINQIAISSEFTKKPLKTE